MSMRAWCVKLAALLEKTGLTEIEFEAGEQRIRVTRGSTVVQAAAPAAAPVRRLPQHPPPAMGRRPAPSCRRWWARPMRPRHRAPIISSRSATACQKGQTLLIIEAMKVMNPIPAPHAGTVKEILFDDGRPVEYGDILMVVA